MKVMDLNDFYDLKPGLLICIVAFVWIYFLPVGAAAAEPVPELIAKIQQRYDNIRSLKADFVQETHSQATNLGTSARGTLYVRKPEFMRWQYEEPEQWFLIRGEKSWHYVADDKTVYEQTIRFPELLRLFSDPGKIVETFRITRISADQGSGLHRLELLPRDPEFPASMLTIWVDSSSYLVVRVKTEDSLGNVNDISLSNIQVNLPLPGNLFKLDIPEGAEVSRQ